MLQDISPDVICDELIDYWFSNDALLAELALIRTDGVEVHLVTVQDHELARYIWDQLDFRSRFDGLHYAAELGCSKPDGKFYKSIEARTGFRSRDLFLIDDQIANVEGAIMCGWAAAHWTGKSTLQSVIADQL